MKRLPNYTHRLRPGTDPTRAVNELYSHRRTYPHQLPHDAPRQRTPGYATPIPTDGEYAHYGQATRPEHVTPAFDEQAPQFTADKHGATYDNDADGWVRGKGPEAPHPHFDHGGSGHRYDTKVRR